MQGNRLIVAVLVLLISGTQMGPVRAQGKKAAPSGKTAARVQALISQAEQAFALDPKRARGLAERAEAEAERLPATHATRLQAVVLRASLEAIGHLAANEAEQALPWAEKALAASQTQTATGQAALPATGPEHLGSLRLVGGILIRVGRPGPAQEHLQKILDLDPEADFGGDSAAELRIQIAECGLALRTWTIADTAGLQAWLTNKLRGPAPLTLYAQAITTAYHANHHARLAAVQAGAAAAEAPTQGDRSMAYAAVMQELALALETAGLPSPISKVGQLFLAQQQLDEGELADAEQTLAGVSELAERADVAVQFKVLGHLLRSRLASARRDFELVRGELRRAHTLATAGNYLSGVASAADRMGDELFRLGDTAGSVRWFREAATAWDQPATRDLADRARSLLGLARVLATSGTAASEEVPALFAEARRILEAQSDVQLAQVPWAHYWSYLGQVNLAAGDLPEAQRSFEKFHALVVESFGANHWHTAEADVDLAWVALSQGQAAAASDQFQGALETFERMLGDHHRRTAEVLAYVARARALAGQPDAARTALQQAVTLEEQRVAELLQMALSERDRLAAIQELRVHAESPQWPGIFDAYLELAPDLGEAAEVQYARVLGWKGLLARHTLPSAADLPAAHPARALAEARERALEALRGVYYRSQSTAPDPNSPEVRDLAERVEESERALRQALQDAPPDAVSVKQINMVKGIGGLTSAEVAAALAPGWALVDVLEYRRAATFAEGAPAADTRQVVAFLSRPGQPCLRLELGKAKEIEQAARRFQAALSRPGLARDALDAEIQPLAALVRTPLVPHLDGVELLLISGDGCLNQIPWGALPGRASNTWWIEDLAFAQLSTAEALVHPSIPPSSPAAGLLVVGDVTFATGGGNTFRPLPQTAAEAQRTQTRFARFAPQAPSTLLVQRAATETAVLRGLAGRQYVHLATHGFYLGSAADTFAAAPVAAQLDSALVLAPEAPGATARDQFLTCEELARLDLRGTDLVVLSACETGLGRALAGQSQIGLVTALERAGVRRVVNSLWQVHEQATPVLMDAFYQNLWQKQQSPALALCQAQRQLIASTARLSDGVELAHPFCWAAFVLSGEPGPVEPPAANTD